MSEIPSLAAVSPTSRGIVGALTAYLDTPVERRVFDFFKAFLALKLYLAPLLDLGPDGSLPSLAGLYQVATTGSSLILLLACVITIASPANYKFGLWIFLVRKFAFISGTLPFTANHAGLEFLLLSILLIFPATQVDAPVDAPTRAGAASRVWVDGRACRLIVLAILSVYFWSGIQKLYHGYYLNGEFFSLILFATKGEAAGGFFRSLLLFGGEALGLSALPRFSQPNWLLHQSFEAPAWVIYFFLAQCWMAVVAEIGLPLLLLFSRTRKLGSVLLLPLAMAIAVVSGEIDFAMTNFACLLLLFPRQVVWSYPTSYLALWLVHCVRVSGVFSA